MASKLPGPTMDTPPGDNPAPGITRPELTDNSWSKTGSPKEMANQGMDVDFPSQPKTRNLNGPNNRT